MANIAIVGAGRVGQAFYRILQHIPSLRDSTTCLLIDSSSELLERLAETGAPVKLAGNKDTMEAVLREFKPHTVVCSTPYYVNVQVADIAARLGSNYIDFTEDNAVTRAIEQLNVSRITFVPQTGLAPGLVSYIGHSLFEGLGEPYSLDLRVGALPLVSFGPAHYAITWSPNGLINEYVKPAYRKVDGDIEEVAPLSDEEHLVVNGVRYEGFTTAGGVGNLLAYASIPNVEYKTLRYPGHLEYIQKLLNSVAEAEDPQQAAVELAMQSFQATRNDVVVLVAHASDRHGHSASAGIHFYPSEAIGLTALELTTAGTGVAVLELLLSEQLPKGTLASHQVPFKLLRSTAAGRLVMSHGR